MTWKHHLHSKAKCEARPRGQKRTFSITAERAGAVQTGEGKVVLSARDIPSPGEQARRASFLVQQSTGTVSSIQDFDVQHPALLGNQAQLSSAPAGALSSSTR